MTLSPAFRGLLARLCRAIRRLRRMWLLLCALRFLAACNNVSKQVSLVTVLQSFLFPPPSPPSTSVPTRLLGGLLRSLVTKLTPQRLKLVFRLLPPLDLLLKLFLHLSRLAFEEINECLLLILAEGNIFRAFLGKLGTTFAVRQAALQPSIGAQGSFLRATFTSWNKVIPLIFGGEGVEKRFGRFVELHNLEEFRADATRSLLVCLHLLIAIFL